MRFERWLVVAAAVAILGTGAWVLLRDGVPSSGSFLASENARPTAAALHKIPVSSTSDHESTSSGGHVARTLSIAVPAPRDVALHYDAFAKRAESGDIDSIRALVESVRGCGNLPRDPGKQQAELAILQQGLKAAGAEASFDAVRAGKLQAYERCALFSPDQADSEKHWLRLGVLNGADELIGDYYFQSVGSFPQDLQGMAERSQFEQEAKDLLQSAADRGAAGAYLALSDAYDRGMLGFSVNPVESYGYLQAFITAIADEPGAPIDTSKNNLDRLGSRLSEQQLEEARSIAARISANCCR